MIDRAMVLAAGLGKRMRPITDHTPKPLVPVLGRPMLGRALDQLAAAGVRECVVNAHYLADQIAAYVADWPAPHVDLIREEILLETGGGVVNALPVLGAGPFFVVNADTLWFDPPGCAAAATALARLTAAFDPTIMDALLLVHPTAHAVGYHGPGDLHVDADGRARFRAEGEIAAYAFAGVSVACAQTVAGRRVEPFSMSDVWRASARAGRLHAVMHQGLWLHVGAPQDLVAAEAFLLDRGFTQDRPVRPGAVATTA